MISYKTSKGEFPLVPEGQHKAVIMDVDTYNNPSGEDKLIVKFALSDGTKHNQFITPEIMDGDGFRVFSDLLKLVNHEGGGEGEFDETLLQGLECLITIKHNEGRGKHEGKIFANVMKVESFVETMSSSEEDKKKE